MLETDLPVVMKNETRSYAYPWTLGMFQDCLEGQPPYDCRVGVRGGSVIAHAILSVGAGESHLLNVCIARDLQGQGLGRVMLRQTLRRATQLGAESMFLEVRPSNAVAIALYGSVGFRQIGVRKDYYPGEFAREDALVFALDLTNALQSV